MNKRNQVFSYFHIAQKILSILFILPLTFSYFNRLKQNGYPSPPLTLAFSVLLITSIFLIVVIIIALSQRFAMGNLYKNKVKFYSICLLIFLTFAI